MSTAHLERGFRRALAAAGLEHEELAFLHRELDVLHVAVMRFQARRRCATSSAKASGITSSIDGRLLLAASRARLVIDCGVRMPATTSSPCALIRNSP